MSSVRSAVLFALGADPERTTCVRCSREILLGDPVFDGLYVDPHGRLFPHHLCNGCGLLIHRSPEVHREVANRVELMFSPAAGNA